MMQRKVLALGEKVYLIWKISQFNNVISSLVPSDFIIHVFDSRFFIFLSCFWNFTFHFKTLCLCIFWNWKFSAVFFFFNIQKTPMKIAKTDKKFYFVEDEWKIILVEIMSLWNETQNFYSSKTSALHSSHLHSHVKYRESTPLKLTFRCNAPPTWGFCWLFWTTKAPIYAVCERMCN